MNDLKKLPIGIQTFSKLRNKNRLYIDKTKYAYDLIENFEAVFLSRPRRFGKSLFLDTLHSIFEGKKELFKDLYIYDKWDWNDKYPVIKISWAGDFRTLEATKQRAYRIFQENQKALDIKCEFSSIPSDCFTQLIQEAYKKYNKPVVILIDEYDKPILDALDIPEVAKENRELLKSIYSIIKENDSYIKFSFLTGVSKFSKASIFSGLNNLEDISLNPHYGNVCGYTQNDVETTFIPYLKGIDLKKVKEWYNGYNFLKDDVYNPFDLLLFIKNDYLFKNYWFETGTPTFLIKLIKEQNYFIPNLANLVIDTRLINSFDIDNLDIEVVLYQAGYLTIKEMQITPFETIEYRLELPNKEVKQSLNDILINSFTKNNTPNREKIPLYQALVNKDLKLFEKTLTTIYANIPHNNSDFIKQYEGFYVSIFYIYLQSLGITIIGEDVTNKGRIDLTIILNDVIYIIEFKMGTGNALGQIKTNKYYQKYMLDEKDIYLVGINFTKEERNITKFDWEQYK